MTWECNICGQTVPDDEAHICDGGKEANIRHHYNTKPEPQFRFKCPNCGGCFQDWYWPMIGIVFNDNEARCPFCYTKRGQYRGKYKEDKILEDNVG